MLGTSRPFGVQAQPRHGQSGQAGFNSALPDLLAADMPGVNVWNSALGSSIIASSPGYYVAGDVAISGLIASQVTAILLANPGAKNAALLWAGTNDAGHAAADDAAHHPGYTGAQLIPDMDVDICTRLDDYIAALFVAGVMKIVACTEPPAPAYYGGPTAPAQQAYNRVMASFNAHVLALSDPRIIVADLATLAGFPLAPDGLHYTDYAPAAAFLLSYCQAAVA